MWGSGCIDPDILDLGTIWRWAVSLTLRPLYCRRNRPQNRSLQRTEEKNLASAGTRTQPLCRPARSKSLNWLRYPGSRTILPLPKQFTRCLLINSTEESEKLMIVHLVDKFLAFYGTRCLLSMSTIARNDAQWVFNGYFASKIIKTSVYIYVCLLYCFLVNTDTWIWKKILKNCSAYYC
jgi:hypothetical protein